MVSAVLVVASVVLFYWLFYGKVVARFGGAVELVLKRTSVRHRHPRREVDLMSKLCAATLAQVAFALLMMWWFDAAPRLPPASVLLPIIAPLLGLAELSLATLLGRGGVAIRLIGTRSGQWAASAQTWAMEGRGGWIAQFTATLKVIPRWAALLVVGAYVTGEEVVFRAVVLSTLDQFGAVVAVTLSATLFVIAQVFHMPTARAAYFPVVGALVIGFVHGTLYWLVRDVASLALAHLAFLLGALFLAPPQPPARPHR